MPDPLVQRRLITDAVLARLSGQSWKLYDGEVPSNVPLIGGTGGRIQSYVVAYPFGGRPGPDAELSDTAADLEYTIQLDCAAAYREDTEYLVDQVNLLMYRWTPTVSGLVFGSFRPPLGYDPGPVRRNGQAKPPRFWVPLQYRINVTAT